MAQPGQFFRQFQKTDISLFGWSMNWQSDVSESAACTTVYTKYNV